VGFVDANGGGGRGERRASLKDSVDCTRDITWPQAAPTVIDSIMRMARTIILCQFAIPSGTTVRHTWAAAAMAEFSASICSGEISGPRRRFLMLRHVGYVRRRCDAWEGCSVEVVMPMLAS
jgi:hypothetical protein